MFDFNQRVYLRRDPLQYGRIGPYPHGAYYDVETRSQDVFWENPGNDIVSVLCVDDLMDEQEYHERRRLFIGAIRRPEMRLLRLALRALQWDHGIDWRAITELELCPYGYRRECCMVITERYLLVCLDALRPDLAYEDFFLWRLHDTADPDCMCEYCEEERKVSA